MMRFGPVSRLMSRSDVSDLPEKTYELAREYLSLVRSTEKLGRPKAVLGPVQPLRRRFNAWQLERMGPRRDGCWGALCTRYQGLMLEVHRAAGSPLSTADRQAAVWAAVSGRVQTSVTADPRIRCFPALLWGTATRTLRLRAVDEERLHCKFHLRALLDELPSSDARGALLVWAFSGGSGFSPTDEQLDLIATGCAELSDHMLALGSDLGKLTQGTIMQEQLGSPSVAPSRVRTWLFGA